MAEFTAQNRVFTKSQYSETDWTKQCVGVGSLCNCHQDIADSVTESIVGGFSNAEFTAFMKAVAK